MASTTGDSMALFAAELDGQSLSGRSSSESSEDELAVRAAREGDRAAFGRLYERYARMVHGVLLAKVPADAVDDLVQDVFMRALRRVSTLRKHDCFGAWLAAIARNLANDYYRRSPPEEQLDDNVSGEETGCEARDRSDASVDRASAIAALDAIRSLPDAYRETLILRFVEGMTGPEIAERTGLTHGSVRVNLHRGMQLLRERVRLNAPNASQEKEKEIE
jgi:RNA polymerase sigma-70 factor, ECF subfamily